MGYHLTGFLSIVLIDLVLSGDNALVIGMACAGLPPRQRRLGILLGSLAAIGMRIALAAGAAALLQIPLLHAAGGLMLLWIAFKLAGNTVNDHSDVERSGTLWEAVRTIAAADLVMSLDNVLAVGAIARDNLVLLVVGLGLTIPIIMWGSGLVAALMRRAPWLTYVGAAVLSWTAAVMIAEDPLVPIPSSPLVPLTVTVLVLGAALYGQRRRA